MLIDWARVDELRDEIGAEDFDEVIAVFVDETAEVVQGLPGASATALPGVLHFIKGSSENVGFRELARLCRQGELAIREDEVVDRTALVATFDESCLVLAERLGAEAGAAG